MGIDALQFVMFSMESAAETWCQFKQPSHLRVFAALDNVGNTTVYSMNMSPCGPWNAGICCQRQAW